MVKLLPTKKILLPDSFTGKFSEALKDEIISIHTESSRRLKKGNASFHRDSLTMQPTLKKNYKKIEPDINILF